MGFRNATMTSTKIIETKEQPQLASLFAHYMFCAVVGLLGGAVGVGLSIALAILIQTLFLPETPFSPGVIVVTIISVIFGLIVSWLLTKLASRIFAAISADLGSKGLEIVLVFSTLASLLQSILFMRGV